MFVLFYGMQDDLVEQGIGRERVVLLLLLFVVVLGLCSEEIRHGIMIVPGAWPLDIVVLHEFGSLGLMTMMRWVFLQFCGC